MSTFRTHFRVKNLPYWLMCRKIRIFAIIGTGYFRSPSSSSFSFKSFFRSEDLFDWSENFRSVSLAQYLSREKIIFLIGLIWWALIRHICWWFWKKWLIFKWWEVLIVRYHKSHIRHRRRSSMILSSPIKEIVTEHTAARLCYIDINRYAQYWEM